MRGNNLERGRLFVCSFCSLPRTLSRGFPCREVGDWVGGLGYRASCEGKFVRVIYFGSIYKGSGFCGMACRRAQASRGDVDGT